MTIRNHQKFMDEQWDWGIFQQNKCFGETKIEPTDIDGLTERKGYFLFIEAKSPGVKINKGQEILHNSLLDTGVFSIIRLWGHAKNYQVSEIEFLSHLGNIDKKIADVNFLLKVTARWFLKINDPATPYAANHRAEIQKYKIQIKKHIDANALLLREYLIEKSGQFMDSGMDKALADSEASELAHKKFGVDQSLCLGILAGVK